MIVADAGRAVALASLLVAYAGGLLGYAQVAVVAFVEGAFDPFFNIAETGAIRQVVPRPQLPDAMARDGARRYAGVLVGPPLGGALFGIARVLPFAADCVSYAFSVVTLLAMRAPFQEERVEAPGRLRSQFAGGVRFLWEHAFLRSSAVMFAAGNFAGSALFLLLVVVARQQGYSAGTIGLLVAAIGAVGVVGSFVAPPLQRRVSMRTIVIGNQWLGLALFAFVAYPHAWVLVVAFVPFGLFNPALNAVVIGYRMAITPDALQGRVNSVARFVAQIV